MDRCYRVKEYPAVCTNEGARGSPFHCANLRAGKDDNCFSAHIENRREDARKVSQMNLEGLFPGRQGKGN